MADLWNPKLRRRTDRLYRQKGRDPDFPDSKRMLSSAWSASCNAFVRSLEVQV
jgi:hypothetical protein